MLLSVPLRFLIPLVLTIFSLSVTSLGYLVIREQMKMSIEETSISYAELELNKLQLLTEQTLRKNNLPLIEQLHAGKITEEDLLQLIIIDPDQQIIASTQLDQIGQPWRRAATSIDTAIADKVILERSYHVHSSNHSEVINAYSSLCPESDNSSGKIYQCGLIYYQLDLKQRMARGTNWLVKQTMYIGVASALAIITLIIGLHFAITRRVTLVQNVLSRWASGERHIKVEIDGNDEIADISRNINELLTQFADDEENLIYNQQLTKAIIQSANYSMITTDENGVIKTMNNTAQRILGYSEKELAGIKTPGIFHDKTEVIQRAEELSLELDEIIEPGFEAFVAKARRGGFDEHNWTYIRKGGTRFTVRLSVSAILNHDGELSGFLGIAHDISAELKSAEKLENMAYYDQLTQLPNRVLYRDRLEQAIRQAKRIESQVAVLFLDLDKFKYVNDSYGHEVGDRLLVQVADMLRHCTRESDTVCRLGGDEFTIILGNVHARHQRRDISRICQKIINMIYQPIFVDEREINIGVSIGIAIYPDDGTSITQLNKAADMAMYAAKDAGRGCFYFYSAGLDLNEKN